MNLYEKADYRFLTFSTRLLFQCALCVWFGASFICAEPSSRLENNRKKWELLSGEERQRIMSNYKRWKSLPDHEKDLIRKRMDVFTRLPAKEQIKAHEIARGMRSGKSVIVKTRPQKRHAVTVRTRIKDRTEKKEVRLDRKTAPAVREKIERPPRPERMEKPEIPERLERIENSIRDSSPKLRR